MSTNQIQDSESVTCGTVLTSHNTRSKTVPLIKWIEISAAVLQNVIFPEK